MSYLTLPIKLKDALPLLREIILDRYTAWGEAFKGMDIRSFSGPKKRLLYNLDTQQIQSILCEYRYHILRLYRAAFPLENFGKWSVLRPNSYKGEALYKDGEDIDLKKSPLLRNAIAEELKRAKINPDGFLWQLPYRIGDGDFIRACYHLLYNCILYVAPAFIQFDYEHTFNRNYRRYPDWYNEYFSSAIMSNNYVLAAGYLKNNIYWDTGNMWFTQAGGGGAEHQPHEIDTTLIGTFNFRRKKILETALNSSPDPDVLDVYTEEDLGFFETTMTDNKAIYQIPASELENIDYYRTWGNLKYGFVSRVVRWRETQVKLTKENFPPLNYKYLDV